MKKLKTSDKFLDQDLVTEFGEFRALETKIKKWLDQVREEFLDRFAEGFICPDGGPYLIVKEFGSQSNVCWRDEFLAHLVRELEKEVPRDRAEKGAANKLAQIEKRRGRTPIDRIAVKPNPAFNGAVMRAIVKKLDARRERGF